METLLVGPVLLWAIVSLYLVKKKGRQWPDLVWGIVGGLILATIFTGLPKTVYNVADQSWTGIVSVAQSLTNSQS
jgi:hypothetical protein